MSAGMSNTGVPETGTSGTGVTRGSGGATRLTTARATRRGIALAAVALVALVGGWWASYPGLIGLGLALTALLALAVAGLAVPVPLTVRRSVEPTRVSRLQECRAVVEVRNGSTWLPVTATGVDLVDGVPTSFTVPHLAPRERVRARIEVPTARRGTVRVGPLVIRRSALADLLRTTQRHGQHTDVVVEPRVLDAVGLPVGARRGHSGADEQVAHGGTDLVGIREYLPGDDLRRVHAGSSARFGTLMVREDADPSAPHLTVLLDDRISSYEGEDFEEAVDVVASLLEAATGTTSPATLRTWSGSVDHDVPVGIVPEPLDPTTLGVLAHLPAIAEPPHPSRRALLGSPDVLAVVTGSQAPLAELLLDLSAAPTGVLLVVDQQPETLVSAQGQVTVLRGPRAEELVHGWRTAVAR